MEAVTDIDILGQFYDQDQWQYAYGQSFLSDIFQGKDSESYRAFKAVRPNEEPSQIVDLLYYNMYLVAIGVQHAGPQLTPETFERGMYAWPGGSGPAGTWTTRFPYPSSCRTCGTWSSCERVKTSTSTPRRPSSRASSRTYTFMPPESRPPSFASGHAWTDSIATRVMREPPRAARATCPWG